MNATVFIAIALLSSGALAQLDDMVGRYGGLRADEVAARAIETSPDLMKSREEIASSAAEVDRAIIAYFPRLQASAGYTRLSSIGTTSLGGLNLTSPLDQYTLQQSLSVPLIDYAWRLPASHRASAFDLSSAEENERAARMQLAANARLAYYDWVRARLQRVVAEQSLEQARQHLELVSRLFEAGSTSRADVLRVEAQVASSELFLQQTKSQEIVRDDQLRTLMHDDSGKKYEIGEDLQPQSPALGTTVDDLIKTAWSSRHELRSLADSAKAAENRADATRASALPRLDGTATLTNAQPNQRYFPQREQFDQTWAAGVQLSWSPNDVADRLKAARGADAKAAQVEARRLALRDSIRSEVEQAHEALRQAGQALDSTARGLAAAEESHRVRRELFTHGRATSVELTDAETQLTQARLDAIGARLDQRAARVRLDYAIGK